MARKRIAALCSGGGTNLEAVLAAIEGGGIDGEVVLVIASNSRAYALQRAAARGIPTRVHARQEYPDAAARDAAILRDLQAARVDLVLLAGYLGIVSADIIAAYENKILNIHPSLLPAFGGQGCYGLRVHEAVLAAGVKVTGATVHFVDEGVDTGKILLQKAVDVRADDTPEVLQARVMAEAEHVLFPEAVRLFCADKIQIQNGRVQVV